MVNNNNDPSLPSSEGVAPPSDGESGGGKPRRPGRRRPGRRFGGKGKPRPTGSAASTEGASAESTTAAAGDAAAQDAMDAPVNDGKQRLHKALAQTGLGSRREMEALIAEGQVQINGETASVGQSVEPGDRVHVKRRKVNVKFGDDKPRVMIYHKPPGEIVSRDDPEGRPTVFDSLKAPDHGKWVAVGRLDFNSEGLLLFTTYGELANRLMHPRYQIIREYSVRVLGELTPEQEDQLIDGIELEDGPARVLSLEVEGGEGANRWYRLTLQEGRNREVRRMFEALGLTVSRLIRIRYGDLLMPSWLKRGQSKLLDEAETFALLTSVGLRSNSPRAQLKRALKGAPVPTAQIGAMRNAREHELARDGRQANDPATRTRAGGGKKTGRGKPRIDPLATSFGFDTPRGGARRRPPGVPGAAGAAAFGAGGGRAGAGGRRNPNAPTVIVDGAGRKNRNGKPPRNSEPSAVANTARFPSDSTRGAHHAPRPPKKSRNGPGLKQGRGAGNRAPVAGRTPGIDYAGLPKDED